MRGTWYDTNVYNNVRYCSHCLKKVATNKTYFDFDFCPYCGDKKNAAELIDYIKIKNLRRG